MFICKAINKISRPVYVVIQIIVWNDWVRNDRQLDSNHVNKINGRNGIPSNWSSETIISEAQYVCWQGQGVCLLIY